MTANAGYNMYNGKATALDYGDFTVGTIGLLNAAALQWTTYGIPIIGEGVALYSWGRLWFDLGGKYGFSKWYGNDDTRWFK